MISLLILAPRPLAPGALAPTCLPLATPLFKEVDNGINPAIQISMRYGGYISVKKWGTMTGYMSTGDMNSVGV